jgi:hypothetical protein
MFLLNILYSTGVQKVKIYVQIQIYAQHTVLPYKKDRNVE